MKGIMFALTAGAGIALQGIANARIGQGIGTWQAASMTQLTGFVTSLAILLILGRGGWRRLGEVKPVYRAGGALAALIISANMAAIGAIGATVTVAVVLIAQLMFTFAVDLFGWFSVAGTRIGWTQIAGIGVMVAGILILSL
ncbi:DMT family transporter [Cohnella sp. JJ-181]|uniref:DMT family transporter n=1 Tax=Cohnella rhizoplanae TaxID=2974897 RepID=UPI0022FFB1A5|nr:DMT family transporter [Cohnella sp. JJ-181]CAI6032446.1 hypothetical protein COHCIP112018_00758 [Cohnella sp. JJ-181]